MKEDEKDALLPEDVAAVADLIDDSPISAKPEPAMPFNIQKEI